MKLMHSWLFHRPTPGISSDKRITIYADSKILFYSAEWERGNPVTIFTFLAGIPLALSLDFCIAWRTATVSNSFCDGFSLSKHTWQENSSFYEYIYIPVQDHLYFYFLKLIASHIIQGYFWTRKFTQIIPFPFQSCRPTYNPLQTVMIIPLRSKLYGILVFYFTWHPSL